MEDKKQFLNYSEDEKKQVACIIYSATGYLLGEIMRRSKKRGIIVNEIHISINEEAFKIDNGTVYVKANMSPVTINTEESRL